MAIEKKKGEKKLIQNRKGYEKLSMIFAFLSSIFYSHSFNNFCEEKQRLQDEDNENIINVKNFISLELYFCQSCTNISQLTLKIPTSSSLVLGGNESCEKLFCIFWNNSCARKKIYFQLYDSNQIQARQCLKEHVLASTVILDYVMLSFCKRITCK